MMLLIEPRKKWWKCSRKLSMHNTVKELLIEAQGKVRHGWCQDTPARNKDGEICYSGSPDAVSFCAAGAIHSKWINADPNELKSIRDAFDAVNQLLSPLKIHIMEYNDQPRRTQQ